MSKRVKDIHQQYGSDVVHKFANLVESIETHNPSQKDINALQNMLDDHPDLWRIAGDLAYQTAQDIINHHTTSQTLKMSLEYGWEELRLDMGCAAADPLEKMLIEQVLLCWLYFTTIQRDFAQILNSKTYIKQETILNWEKRITAAQQRYLRACESLARIRKLARRTPLQVNIATNGGQQINGVNGNGVTEPLADTNRKRP